MSPRGQNDIFNTTPFQDLFCVSHTRNKSPFRRRPLHLRMRDEIYVAFYELIDAARRIPIIGSLVVK